MLHKVAFCYLKSISVTLILTSQTMDLLIAILIALGCTVSEGASEEDIKADNYDAYVRAVDIRDSGSYERTSGGVVIITEIGD